MANLKIDKVCKEFGDTTVLKDINLEIADGEFTVFIGGSGCGKSTLLRMICGLEEITSGEIYINGKPASKISPQKRRMSMVFQSYALYPHLNVFENIAYGLRVRKIPKKEIEKKVHQAARLLNIDNYLDRLPKNLSGGQRQRVAMGRSIVREPDFFLFDEPLSNLDAKLRVVMRKEIKSLHSQLGTTALYVTHDQIEAMTLAHRIVLLDSGKIVQVGPPEELYESPNCVFTATFLGAPQITLIDGSIKIEKSKPTFITSDGIHLPIQEGLQVRNAQKVKLGIRPRSFFATTSQKGVPVEVDLLEYTGAEDIVYGKIGKNEVTIVFSRKESYDKNQPLFVNYNSNKTYLFDAQTTLAITK